VKISQPKLQILKQPNIILHNSIKEIFQTNKLIKP